MGFVGEVVQSVMGKADRHEVQTEERVFIRWIVAEFMMEMGTHPAGILLT